MPAYSSCKDFAKISNHSVVRKKGNGYPERHIGLNIDSKWSLRFQTDCKPKFHVKMLQEYHGNIYRQICNF